MKRFMKKWTPEEDNRLLGMVGLQPFKVIAKRLGRTESGVERRLERLEVAHTRSAQGFYTAYELADTIQVDSHTVLLWINKYNLPHERKIVRREREYIFIDPNRFWKWAEKNKQRINFAKIPIEALLPEPEWVREERRKDRLTIPKRTQQIWSAKEDMEMLRLREKGYTQKEVGDILGRSRRGVQKRQQFLKENNIFAVEDYRRMKSQNERILMNG